MSATGAVDQVRVPLPDPIRVGRVVAIGRRLDPSLVEPIAQALIDAGIRAFEITLDSPSALERIATLAGRFDPGRLLVGAGTVLDVDQARAALEAGARFIVSPHGDAALTHWVARQGVPVIPGAMTPTEILAAWRAGASAVKVFPASAVGPAFVREVGGPLPEIPLIPTGGITVESAPSFIAAGAVAVGIGSWLTGVAGPTVVRERAREIAAAVQAVDAGEMPPRVPGLASAE